VSKIDELTKVYGDPIAAFGGFVIFRFNIPKNTVMYGAASLEELEQNLEESKLKLSMIADNRAAIRHAVLNKLKGTKPNAFTAFDISQTGRISLGLFHTYVDSLCSYIQNNSHHGQFIVDILLAIGGYMLNRRWYKAEDAKLVREVAMSYGYRWLTQEEIDHYIENEPFPDYGEPFPSEKEAPYPATRRARLVATDRKCGVQAAFELRLPSGDGIAYKSRLFDFAQKTMLSMISLASSAGLEIHTEPIKDDGGREEGDTCAVPGSE